MGGGKYETREGAKNHHANAKELRANAKFLGGTQKFGERTQKRRNENFLPSHVSSITGTLQGLRTAV